MSQVLKVGIFLAINTQEELNELAELTGAFVADSIIIDREFVTFTDYDGAIEGSINVVPLKEYIEENPHMNIKTRKFKSWKRNLKL